MHYTPNGTEAVDQTSIGLVFAKEPPMHEVRTGAFFNRQFVIPAGATNQRVDATLTFNQDATIWSLLPHTHLRGKAFEYTLKYPDGRQEIVLRVPTYDFNWQTDYWFSEPVRVPKGSTLTASAWYDNSADNPSNPDPSTDVRWGDQTWEEMQFTGIDYSVDPPVASTTAPAGAASEGGGSGR
jgi:hypothetical protein